MAVHKARDVAGPSDLCSVEGMRSKPDGESQAGDQDEDSAHSLLILSCFPAEMV